MSVANAINIVAFERHNSDFKTFFKGPGNILNSSLVFLYCFLLIAFLIYYHVKIHICQKQFKKNPESKDQFENFLESLKTKEIS